MGANGAGNNCEHTCEKQNCIKDNKATPQTRSENSPKDSAQKTSS